MKIITIKRTHYLDDMVLSTIDDENIPFAQCVERPWKNNLPNISCIPEGEYRCIRVASPKFGDTFKILDVRGRENCLFHWGNLSTDSEGCIIVGESFGTVWKEGVKKYGVISSRTVAGQGFIEFLDRLHGLEEFKLVIKNCSN